MVYLEIGQEMDTGQSMTQNGESSSVDISLLIDCLAKCPRKDGSMATDHYVCAVTHMFRFKAILYYL